MIRHRHHRAYWAFLGHRLSGIALALFLPAHFLTLGLALEGAATLDSALSFAELPIVKFAEWGLVILLSIHLFFGARVLVLEFLPWSEPMATRASWIVPSAVAAVLIGFVFLAGVF
jgi:fumarate reductase subunit D